MEKKSSEVTVEGGLQGKPVTEIEEELGMAMQKSWLGSGSEEAVGGKRTKRRRRMKDGEREWQKFIFMV